MGIDIYSEFFFITKKKNLFYQRMIEFFNLLDLNDHSYFKMELSEKEIIRTGSYFS